MLKQIPRYTHVSGVSIYDCDEKGQSSEFPAAIDVSVNLPSIEFESSDISLMGGMSIPDTTRVSNLQITATLEADNPRTRTLVGPGLKTWCIRWTETILEDTGLQSVIGFTVYARGFVTAIPEGSKELGSQATADYAMNCIAINKKDSTNHVHYEIDRGQGVLIIDGVDYRKSINDLLG